MPSACMGSRDCVSACFLFLEIDIREENRQGGEPCVKKDDGRVLLFTDELKLNQQQDVE